MASLARLIFVAAVFAAVTALLLPMQMLAHGIKGLWHKALPRWWQVFLCRLLGFRIEVIGAQAGGRPLMLVANHVSWSDIVVLGALGEVSFIAKSDMRDWPLFGLLARLQRTIFVDRDQKRKAGDQAAEIAHRLIDGDVLVLFAEGTTSDGNRVLPFKSSLFGAARAALEVTDRGDPLEHVLLQPVSIAYTRVQGLPMGRYHRTVAAWPGTVGLVKHLSGIIRAGAIDITITYGDPVRFDKASDRKALARQFEADIRAMTTAAMRFSRHETASQG